MKVQRHNPNAHDDKVWGRLPMEVMKLLPNGFEMWSTRFSMGPFLVTNA